MPLPALTALLVGGGPLLRGAWDPWAQFLLQFSLSCGFSAWLVSRIFIGFIPLPSRRTLAWAGSLVFLSAASAWTSPVHGLARAEWWNFLTGLWVFPAMAALSKDDRVFVDQIIRASAWALMVLAFYQHFRLGDARPASALVNQNIYAGAVLMFLPLALERRDWLLASGLLWSMWWTRSVGAWLGLSLAAAIACRRGRPWAFRAAVACAFVCAAAIYGKLDTPEVLHRWGWWKAAAAMAADRPLTGFGPGAFAYVLPAYRDRAPYGLLSLYAHEYPLQTLAEFGLPFAVLWFAGLWRSVTRDESYKRSAAVAVLFQSLWDYTLSMPGVLWLFCYCAASSIPESSQGVNVASRHKLPAAVAVVGLGLVLSVRIVESWRGQRQLALAAVAAQAGEPARARALADRAAFLSPDEPEIALFSARLAASGRRRLDAAADLEEAARLNPYREPTWVELSLAYRNLGRPESARQILLEAGRYGPPSAGRQP